MIQMSTTDTVTEGDQNGKKRDIFHLSSTPTHTNVQKQPRMMLASLNATIEEPIFAENILMACINKLSDEMKQDCADRAEDGAETNAKQD